MLRRRREGAAGLEDGTTSFLGIAALRHGFAAIGRAGGFPAIEAHTGGLTRCRGPVFKCIAVQCSMFSLGHAYLKIP